MTFDKIPGTGLNIHVEWDSDSGVQVSVSDATGSNVPVTRRPAANSVLTRRRSDENVVKDLLNKPLTEEQAAVAMTSLQEVYDPHGNAVTVLSIDASNPKIGTIVTVEHMSETVQWGIHRLHPSRGLLHVIEQRYGKGVTLTDD